MSGFRQPGGFREVVELTGTAYSTSEHDVGKTFVVNGSGGYTVTLHSPVNGVKGGDMLFLNLADQDLIISCNELIVTFNNAAADSVAASTNGEQIGAGFWVHNIGTKWFVCPLMEETATATVATD